MITYTTAFVESLILPYKFFVICLFNLLSLNDLTRYIQIPARLLPVH